MYCIIKGSSLIKFSTSKLKEYVTHTRELTEEQKQDLATKVVHNIYKDYVNKTLGSFVAIKSLKVLCISAEMETYQYCTLKVDGEFYFYNPKVKEIFEFKITKVHPTHVEGTFYGYTVEIPSDHLAGSLATYNSNLNFFQVGDLKIKTDDLVRARITSVGYDFKLKKFKLNASCRSSGSGKLR